MLCAASTCSGSWGAIRCFTALAQWWGGPLEPVLTRQLEHAEWEGFRFYDLIFPLFLFLVGVVLPYSLESHRRKGDSSGQLLGRIGRRCCCSSCSG